MLSWYLPTQVFLRRLGGSLDVTLRSAASVRQSCSGGTCRKPFAYYSFNTSSLGGAENVPAPRTPRRGGPRTAAGHMNYDEKSILPVAGVGQASTCRGGSHRLFVVGSIPRERAASLLREHRASTQYRIHLDPNDLRQTCKPAPPRRSSRFVGARPLAGQVSCDPRPWSSPCRRVRATSLARSSRLRRK